MLSTCKDAKEAGFTALKEAGFTCKDARAAGFTALKEAGFTCKDVREAGFTCKDAREAGFKAGKECYEAGFTYEEGRAAGFPSRVNIYGTFYDAYLYWQPCKSPSKNSNPGCPLPPQPPSAWRASPRRLHRAAARAARPFQVVRVNHSSLSRVRR